MMQLCAGNNDEHVFFRRFSWLAQIVWAVLLLAALLFNQHLHQEQLLTLARQSAALTYTQIDNLRRWNFDNDGIYVVAETVAPDQVVTNDGLRLQRMVPSQMLSNIRSSSTVTGARSQLPALDPLNLDNLPDDWEKIQLEAILDSGKSVTANTTIDGEPYYRVMHPLPSGPRCLTCHAPTPLNLHKTMGAFSILVPLKPIQKILQSKEISTGLSLFILWLVGSIGIATTTKTIRKRIDLRDKAQQNLWRSNNLYSALVETNHAIVKLLPRQQLFEKVCELAVRYGSFNLAWVGIINNETKQVEAAAQAGTMGEYIDEITVSIDPDSPYSTGPTSIAIRENRSVIVDDFLGELVGTPWHEAAKRAGIRSSAAIPIKDNGEVIGAFKVYADQTDYFSAEFIQLLEQMTCDLSFALDNLEQLKKYQAAQKLNQTLIDALPYPALLARYSDQHVVIANRKALEMGVVIGEINSCCQRPDERDGDDLQVLEKQRDDGQWDMICWCPVDEAEKDDLYLHFAIDITERKKQEAQINDLANRDPLTGLANRRYFDEQLRLMLEHKKGGTEKLPAPFTLLLLDLNGFKFVNDGYGHPVGDQLLTQIARRLQAALRECDTLCRWGGDEFVIMLPNSTLSQARDLAMRVHHIFKQPFKLGNLTVSSSCSIGMASYPESGDSAETLLKVVDHAMYEAKRDFHKINESSIVE